MIYRRTQISRDRQANAQPVHADRGDVGRTLSRRLAAIVQDRVEDRLISMDGVADLQSAETGAHLPVDIDQFELARRVR
jgi:HAE1 family hydrophobic/amphiphilic exporter-1